MLDQLRRHAKSWLTKSILGAMAVGLTFYFGYTGLRQAGKMEGVGKSAPIATVNGEPIPTGKFNQTFENQMKFYEQLTKGQVPTALAESLKQNVLQKLVQTKIFAQQAKAIGLNVSDKEVAQEIAGNPNLYQNGVFNKKFYLEVFKPGYEIQTGEDYESSLREDLLAEKFENLIRNSIMVTEEELKKEYFLASTRLNLQKVTLDPTQFKEDPENKLKEAETEIEAALNEKTAPKGPSPLDAVKKKYNLKVEETGLHSLRDKAAFVGTPDATEALDCITQLRPEKPVCPQGYSLGNQVVFFKLTERKDPNWAQFNEQKDGLKKSLLSRRQVLVIKQISDSLLKSASIHTSLKSSG